ncbi:MAG TPA: CHAD domain-containing protein, partial [Longimicrobiales bacterium]|nr:CHAD domain-containing protein [Longimicrobiales bacterium]
MSYALGNHEPLRSGLRRIVHEEADGALSALIAARRSPAEADEGIHDARKCFKKIRAVLRLVRHRLPGETYHGENRTWRDAARMLSGVRQSTALAGTIGSLGPTVGHRLPSASLEAFAARLQRRHRDLLEGALRDGGAVERSASMARRAGDRIDLWLEAGSGGFDTVGDGLRKVYERGRTRMADAYAEPTGPRFHEFRKRAKYLEYQMRILAPTWERPSEPWAESQHDLTSLLGEGNDLTDLITLLGEEPDLLPGPHAPDILRRFCDRRRCELWEAARPLAVRLYAEAPDRFVERM